MHSGHKFFLSLYRQSAVDTYRVHFGHQQPRPSESEPDVVFSAIFSLDDQKPPTTPAIVSVVLLYPKCIRETAQVLAVEARRFAAHPFLSHGLASLVLLCTNHDQLAALKDLCRSYCNAIEEWPLEHSGELRRSSVTVEFLSAAAVQFDPPFKMLSEVDLPSDAQAQVRQFNANIDLAWKQSGIYAPEILPLLHGLNRAMTGACKSIREAGGLGGGLETYRYKYRFTIELIEVNAAFNLLSSQAFSSIAPTLDSRYPVAEYSLLGIGGCLRSAWRIYSHIANIFSRAGLTERILQSFSAMPGVRIYKNRGAFDQSAWKECGNLSSLPSPIQTDTELNYQIPYFSSRWGFHETLHTLSLSWQCLHSSSTSEWNILTISHEFLHSHVTEMLSALIPVSDGQLAAICEKYSQFTHENDTGSTLRESLQIALLHFQCLLHARAVAESNGLANPSRTKTEIRVTPAFAKHLKLCFWDYINELTVHILDYLYFYEAIDAVYVKSLWRSWSLVPKVLNDMPHYLQRTLCALASFPPPGCAEAEAFEDAIKRLTSQLTSLNAESFSPVIAEALRNLEDAAVRNKLQTEFLTNWYLIRLVRTFLFSIDIGAALRFDTTTTSNGDGTRGYPVKPPDFSIAYIQSPVEFLFWRFRENPVDRQNMLDGFLSLWQFAILV